MISSHRMKYRGHHTRAPERDITFVSVLLPHSLERGERFRVQWLGGNHVKTLNI